jgi:hypothetical protein
LVRLYSCRTAVEEDVADVVEVVNNLFNSSGTTVASVELSLEVSELSEKSCVVCATSFEVAAESVDLSVESVNFCLVVGTNESEVMCTVRVLEVVCDTSFELEVHIVRVVVRIVTEVVVFVNALVAVHIPKEGGLDRECPSLSFAKVEVEVKTYLGSK